MDISTVCAKIAEASVFSTGFLNTANLKGRPAMSNAHSNGGKSHYNTIDITGLKVKRWTVIDFETGALGGSRWRCRCECGTERVYRSQCIRRGSMSDSCGCVPETRPYRIKHGLTRNNKKLLSVWSSMVRRCHNPLDSGYKNYGGRGISVCRAWRTDAKAFAEYIGLPPEDGEYQIDRIDNDGNYEPGNVRWATRSENVRNTRLTVMVEWDGKRVPLITLCEQLGFSYSCVFGRVKRGMSPEQAIIAGKRIIGAPKRRHLTNEQVIEIRRLKSEGWSYSQLRKRYGCSQGALQQIIYRKTYAEVV
jgi:hypothetical protein